MLKTRLLAATALAAGAFVFPNAAFAQTAPAEQIASEPATDQAESEEAIVVTGSRIRRPNLESTVPITSISGEQFFQQGQTNIGDTLNDLPQLRSTFAQQNPGLGIGIGGLNLLDLRGLGTQRTLVLVNGRRHVAADILNNAVSPDINTIPNDLIERVDIVTGGSSAIYGSDAIAGVVNFVLRRDYNGLQVRGQAGVAEKGFGGNQYLSAMYGKNFDSGKGNITLHAEYARADRVYASDIPAFRRQDAFGVVDADGGAGIVNGGDGFPDRTFIRDIRSASIHYNGLVPIVQPGGAGALCGIGTAATNGGPNHTGTPYNCTYIFNDAGRLTPQTGQRYGAGIIGGIAGGNGQTGREGNLLSVLPYTERYNFNLLTHYEFSPAVEVFLEAKWNRVNAVGNNAGPTGIQGTFGQFDYRERFRLDNPFLNAQDSTTLRNAILTSGFNTDLLARTALTPADVTALNNGSYRFVNARSLTDVGNRDEHFQRDTYRFVAGLRGTFNDDWSYELSANYGKFKENITTTGFIDRQRFMLALDAGRNPVTGQIQCRSQYDPASALPIQRTDDVSNAIAARNAARLAADIAACVPYNAFGAPDNSASINYFSRTFSNRSSLDQLVLSGYVSGDLSQLFELPGGPVRFALGAEYRRENASYTQDPFVTDGFTNGVSIPSFKAKAFEVKEAYGELQLPLIKDQPLFHELTISAAGRVAKYQGDVGTVYSYNAGADWAPIPDVRFRGNFSRAVRAPNVSETGFPLVPNFAPNFVDPCNPSARGAGVRAANCAADLGALLTQLNDVTQSLAIVSGSNPNLEAETSDSLTLGAVFQPRFLRGFNLSVDYYNIKVKNIIVSLTAQAIVNNCYDSATLNNVFCGQFTRFRGSGTGPAGETPGRILGNSLISAPVNFASRQRKGIDVNLSYRTELGPVKLNANLIYTHNLKISNYQDPINPNFENRVLGELGDPKDEFRLDLDGQIGAFTLGYRMRYIGPMYLDTYENLYSLNGLPPANIDYADVDTYPAVFYHDLRFSVDVAKDSTGKNLNLYFGVDNMLDKQPPFGSTATGANTAIYNFRGRNFYAGFRARF
ncbi:TonB-dependent receptor domain-containing protein [Sphingomonas sp.]|uniref:TonB-dependent receptor domain-containing protein n=1 Tax=Sphingomonas sp. TaxID=28214 RepID=UPI003D6DA226